jgi:hypothetical protein
MCDGNYFHIRNAYLIHWFRRTLPVTAGLTDSGQSERESTHSAEWLGTTSVAVSEIDVSNPASSVALLMVARV